MPLFRGCTADFSGALAVVANLDDALALGRKGILAFCCWPLAVSDWPVAVGFWLLAFGFWLLAISC